MSDSDDNRAGRFTVTSINQSGGITAGIVHVGKQQRHVTDADKSQLRTLPKGRSVSISAAMGDADAYGFAEEIRAFLGAEGFQVGAVNQTLMAQPLKGVHIAMGGDPIIIHVGSP